MGPATWVRHPRLSEGQGLFRVTGSFVPSGHLAVGSPWTCPRELTFTIGDSPGLSVLAPIMVFPIPVEEQVSLVRRGPAARHLRLLHPSASRGRGSLGLWLRQGSLATEGK